MNDPAKNFSEALGRPVRGDRPIRNPSTPLYGNGAEMRLRIYLGHWLVARTKPVARKQPSRHLCGKTCTAAHAVTKRLAQWESVPV